MLQKNTSDICNVFILYKSSILFDVYVSLEFNVQV